MTFWIKSRLIIIIEGINKLTKLKRKITIKNKHINKNKLRILNLSLLELKLNIGIKRKYYLDI